jgi:hypothetical protein
VAISFENFMSKNIVQKMGQLHQSLSESWTQIGGMRETFCVCFRFNSL